MEQTYSIKQIIIIMVILLLVIISFYGITILVSNNKEEEKYEKIEESVIQYDEIIVGEIFNQKESNYLILAYDDTDDGIKYKSDINTYSIKENSKKTYLINLLNAFNKKYVASESNFENNFPIFKETTLLEIDNGKIVAIYEGNLIEEKLNELNKE